jgi:hypothetical protein
MKRHCTDQELILASTDEASIDVDLHLIACEHCRIRQQAMLHTLDNAIRVLHRPGPATRRYNWAPVGAAAVAVVATAAFFWAPASAPVNTPMKRWTPGAVRVEVTKASVCTVGAGEQNLPVVPAARAMEVFRRYSISQPGHRKFEVDYLIPPDLGGSDNADNLWPQPYETGVWNARVKDALEDRLRTLVCNGELDLATAQHDIASDWIAAYKKHFRTDRPLVDHAAFVKDRPWE